jgi:hypothetical protein
MRICPTIAVHGLHHGVRPLMQQSHRTHLLMPMWPIICTFSPSWLQYFITAATAYHISPMFLYVLEILIASRLTLPTRRLITRFLPTHTKFLTSIGLFTHLVVAILHQQFCLAIFLSTSSLLVINTSQVVLCFEDSQLAPIF